MIAGNLDEIAQLYEAWGTHNYDEALSQLAHAEQTAALAVHAGAPDALVVAALLHDVGHLLYLGHRVTGPHEETGVAYLAGLFDNAVLDPIAGHVAAKRALCAIDADYHDALSDGSKASLVRQGGPFARKEAEAFATSNADAIALRRWDDLGKVDGLAVQPFAAYLDLLTSLAR